MSSTQIRLIALGVFQRDGKILVMEGFDATKGERFYRPLGGGVEFGERGHETVVRELQEELGAEVQAVRYLCTLENIFVYRGNPSHELVLMYDGEFADEAWYQKEIIHGVEADGEPIIAVWKSLSEFGPDQPPLYPNGLLEHLISSSN